MKPIIINIEGIKIIIEKGEEIKTIPETQHPIQYNNKFSIKRKFYKKTDKQYHRRPNGLSIERERNGTMTALKFSKFDKIVKQEPLLDQNYLFTKDF